MLVIACHAQALPTKRTKRTAKELKKIEGSHTALGKVLPAASTSAKKVDNKASTSGTKRKTKA